MAITTADGGAENDRERTADDATVVFLHSIPRYETLRQCRAAADVVGSQAVVIELRLS